MAVTQTEPVQSSELRLATQLMAAREFVLDLDLFKEDLDLAVSSTDGEPWDRTYTPITMLVTMDDGAAKHIAPGSRLTNVYLDLRIRVEASTGTVQWDLSGFLFEVSGRILNCVSYRGVRACVGITPNKEVMLIEPVLQELQRAALHQVNELGRLLMATLIAE